MTGPRVAPPAANCIGKDKLESMDLAQQIATRVSRAHDSNMKAYKCPHCGYYHVGQVTGKKSTNGKRRIKKTGAGPKTRRP